jgi:aminopeptidase N
MSFRMKKLLFLFLISGFTAGAQEFTAFDSLRGGWHEGRSSFDLLHYHLKLKVNPEAQFIEGSNRWLCRGLSESDWLQVDLQAAFRILAINTSGGRAVWSRQGSSVRVNLPFHIKKNEDFWIEIQYSGQPHPALNPPWDGGFVWSKDENGKPWVGVACEGDGASMWFPSKDHPADEPDSALLEYEVPQTVMAVGNGRFLGKEQFGDSTACYRYRVSYPINHYNITLNIADYKSWPDTMLLPGSGEILQMNFHALPEDYSKAKTQWAQAKKVIRTLSELFGDYPFARDGYRLVQTPYLGMEHQSCISYGDQFRDNAYGFDFILMHETAHEWWGNYISADDHADLWLHESFATYSEALLVEKWKGKQDAYRYLADQKKKIRNRSEMAGKRGVYFNDWKDSDIYYKGSWMLHSMRYAVGDDKRWFDALRSTKSIIGMRPLSADTFAARFSALLSTDFRPFVKQFTQSMQWPKLEFSLQKEKGKEQLSVKWNNAVEGFQYAVPIHFDGRTERILMKNGGFVSENPGLLKASKVEAADLLFLYKLQVKKPSKD